MLSDIALVIAVILLPISCYFSFKLGVNTVISVGNSEKEPVFRSKTPKRLKKFKKLPETEEIRRANAILANIEAYDGTSFGQKEIK